MKKLLALVLSLALAASALAGCGTAASSSAAASVPASSAAVSSSAPAASSTPVTPVDMRIAGLKGPTSMGMVKLMQDAEDGTAKNNYTFTIAGSADELTPKLTQGELDIAAVPANLAAVLYNNTKGAVQLLAVNTLGVIYIVEKGDSVQSLADLKGKTFAFGAPSSTSGSLMPRYFLQQAGMNPEKDFKTVAYSGAHDATVAFVAAGKAEAGVLNTSVWDKLVESKKVDTSKVRVFATTPTYFDYNWTVRGDLDPAIVKKLTAAFLALDPSKPEHKAIMDLQRASKFIATDSKNYDGIEAAAKSAGLLK